MIIEQHNGTLTLIAEESFTFANANALSEQIGETLEKNEKAVQSVVLDLRKADLMDSMGIKLLVGLLKTCQEMKKALAVEVSSPHILRTLNLCKLNQLIEIRQS